jgi:hypothetical protein
MTLTSRRPCRDRYPRACPRCGVMTAEADFGVDRSKASGRRSYCKACDRRRGRAYYQTRKDELYAQRAATREAAWQAELEALAVEHKKRVAAQKKLHAAQVRRQKGVPALDRGARCEPGGGQRESPPPPLPQAFRLRLFSLAY